MPKRKRTPLSDDELLSAIDAAEASAIGASVGITSSDRQDALKRYTGAQYTDELAPIPGRSSVVSRDVADTVDGVLANVIKPFVSTDDTVRFDPLGPDDEERAQQESDFVNFVFTQRNNGFLVLNAAIKDALLLRMGYAKCGWTRRTDAMIETYRGQTDDELALLTQDTDIEVISHTEYPQPQVDPMAPPSLLHDVQVRRTRPVEYVSVEPVPPEEILVSQRARSPCLADTDFVQHRTHKTLSELRQLGYDVADDISDDADGERLEEYARQRNTTDDPFDDPTGDPARRIVLFKETWLLIDRDGDGVAERRRVCQVGKNLLSDEETDIVPIVAFCPLLMPHQHLGISVFDLISDIARIKTALMRQFLDNKYLGNNVQWVVDDSRADADEFMQSRPGGVKRVRGDPASAAMPLVTPDTGPSALQGLEYLDAVRENRTGYTRQTQGLETDALVSKTVGGMVMQLTQSQLRLEMIARTIAETGVRELFRVIHAMTLKFGSAAEKVKLRGKWVEISPREWVRRTDLSITVGLGNASQQTLIGGLMTISQAQQQAMALGLTKPSQIYNTFKKLTNAVGFKNSDEFFTPPQVDPQTGQEAPPPQQPNPAVQVEQVRQQGALSLEQFRAQQDAMKFQAEDVLKQREMSASLELQRSNDERQALLDRQRAELDHQRAQDQLALERYKAEIEVAAKKEIELAKIQAQFALEELRNQHAMAQQDNDAKNRTTQSTMPEASYLQSLFLPATVLRDAGGRVVGVDKGGVVHEVVRDEKGRVAGMRPRESGTMQ